MISSPAPTRSRRTAAWLLCAALLGLGLALTLTADPPVYGDLLPTPWLAAALLPAYVAAHLFSVDFELRRETHSVTLVQLPLLLGVQLVSPVVHLGVRLAAMLVVVARDRQGPVKALYNLGVVAAELGVLAFVVSLVPSGAPAPVMWLALYAGLLAGDLLGAVVLTAVWRLLGLPVALQRPVGLLWVTAPVTLMFAAIAIVTVAAFRVEPLSALVTLLLACGFALAYRAHRRLVMQQRATARLYEFVKDLGPLTPDDPAAAQALETVRELLHAEQLELTVPTEDGWAHLVVADGRAPERRDEGVAPLARQVAATRSSVLHEREVDDSDSMATPLLGSSGLVGILTATERLGATRRYDINDLRLLETVGAELSTALERGRLHRDLHRAATTDPLTGLANLSETTRELTALLETSPAGVVVAAVAVDSFREVNDTLGHQVGDELLLEVTRRLRLSLPDAVVGRSGGGRFVVAVPVEQAGGDAEMFGLGLRAEVEGAADVGPLGTHVRLSVGLARSPEHGDDAATLLRRAETAMYGARHAHGGPVVWAPAYEVQGQRRLAVVTALREALASGAIGVAFQPKVETSTGRAVGVEALARWTHPALGAVSPDEFVPLAEASGLVGLLTTTVLRQSLTVCKGWQRRAPRVGVAVNVSADTMLDPGFVTEVAAALAATDVPAELLTLELTEGVVVSDPQLAAVRMGELRQLGVKLSVDDFGTGYSSLTYLKGLPVDEVKIDKGFVRGLTAQPADRAVVRAVVDIAHTLGLRVVAEGVEREDQQGILRALGVDEVQGYLHARPMPALDMTAWLRGRETARL
jgi:diguanylate cyclase (GGDEF)-like protein